MNRDSLLRSGFLLLTLFLSSCDSGSGDHDAAPVFPGPGEMPAFPLPEHVDQLLVRDGALPFPDVFFAGDELFEVVFNTLDGVGALRLPDGTPLPGRFSRVPPGGGRVTGPNGQSCTACHNSPFGTAAGEAALNVFQDPARRGIPPFNPRNSTSLFGSGVLQRLAEEITEDLHRQRDEAIAAALPGGAPVQQSLLSKEIHYGTLSVAKESDGRVVVDTTGLLGVDPDLVVRPYGWKGDVTTLRDFVRGAARDELGMEGDEVVAKDPFQRSDPDGDGVEGELSIGDITAITVYIGSQEIPQELRRLVALGLVPRPSAETGRLVERGRALFSTIGCSECHKKELRLLDTGFEEPTLRGRGAYLDPEIDPATSFLDPFMPFRYDLITEGDFPRLEPHPQGGAIVRLFGDLRRHDMGRVLSDPWPTEVKGPDGGPVFHEGRSLEVAPSVFLTAELWGVGNSGPWLHDGRAASLEEAILLHGEDLPPLPRDPGRSEAQEARDGFVSLTAEDRLAVIEFLRSLLHFAIEEE